jgi:CO/xanthine dehydrogenase Mo-binding subunit
VAQPDPATWLSLATNGRVIVRTGKVEYGQGILTALTQIAADALRVEPAQVELESAHTHAWPNEGFTVGSTSIEDSGPVMRALGGLLRGRLLQVAAQALGVAAKVLEVQAGRVLLHGQPTDWDYWRAGDRLLKTPFSSQDRLTPDAAAISVGVSLPRVDLKAKFSGGAFIQDLVFPGMRHAVVLRQPIRGARINSFDSERFQARHPAIRWVRRGDFLACAGESERSARTAHAFLDACVQWDVPQIDDVGDDIQQWLGRQPAVEAVLMAGGQTPEASGDQVFEGTWFRPFIAHASIGLSCGLALLKDDVLQVWSHSQGIYALRDAIARVVGLAADSVHVHHVQGAGCYGHNGADDAALDAALVAMAEPGVPIRVQWSRGEELREAPLGAAMAVTIRAAINPQGRISQWQTHIRSTSHLMRPGWWGHPNLLAAPAVDSQWQSERDGDIPEERGGGATRSARPIYAVGSQLLSLALVTSHVRTSALRSLGTFANTLAIEGVMDELAELAGQDPAQFRLAHLEDPRGAAVLRRVMAMSDWQGAGAQDALLGLGLGRYKATGAWCAVVVEIALESEVEVRRCWCAVDGGLIINPDGARNQIEGGIIQALSWTLLEEVRFEGPRALASGWEGYPILRFSQVPPIQTEWVGAEENPPLGLGEASQGPLAAAVANAVSRVVGQRVTQLPLHRDRLMRLLSQ